MQCVHFYTVYVYFHQSIAACFVDEVVITFPTTIYYPKVYTRLLELVSDIYCEMNSDASYLEICFLLSMISSQKQTFS